MPTMYVSSEQSYMYSYAIPQPCAAKNSVLLIPENESVNDTSIPVSRPACSHSSLNSMPSALKPAKDRNVLERSPHPYARHREQVSQNDTSAPAQHNTLSGLDSQSDSHAWDESDRRTSHAASATSESGTEADDERPHLLKALPPSTPRPRKGLKQTDGIVTPLLTPSQLDHDGRSHSQGYFGTWPATKTSQSPKEEDVYAARQLYEKRRRAERIRRLSEGALLGVIGITVMSGPFVYHSLWNWHRGKVHPL